MVPEPIKALLRYPLCRLYYIDDVTDFSGLSVEERSSFKVEYDVILQSRIIDALKWVKDNPEVDLLGILPNLPYSNQVIHSFLMKVLFSLE